MPDQDAARPGSRASLTDEATRAAAIRALSRISVRRHRSRRASGEGRSVTLLIRALRQRGLTQSKAARLSGSSADDCRKCRRQAESITIAPIGEMALVFVGRRCDQCPPAEDAPEGEQRGAMRVVNTR